MDNKLKPNYLVCIGDSEYSVVAMNFAYKMTKKRDGKMIVLHVTDPVNYNGFGIIADKMRVENMRAGKKFLQAMTRNIDMKITLIHREGFIDEEIIKVVEENHNIDMLILGAAAETGAKSKTLQPLVAQIGTKIMIPILIVPGNLTEQQLEMLA